jgi:hypothetical protein
MDRAMRMGTGKWALGAAVVALGVFAAGSAAAATEDEEPSSRRAAVSIGAATATQGGNDHDLWVGRLGFGWYGIGSVPIGVGTGGGSQNDPTVSYTGAQNIQVPAIGVRYWLSPSMGVDAALGFNIQSGSDEVKSAKSSGNGCDANTTCTIDKVSQKAFLLHGGLPLVLGGGKHVTVLLIPELNIGFASGSWKPYVPPGAQANADNTPPNADLSGFLLQLGARAGAEVHFGFMGMPQLALEGSVGAYFQTTNTQVKAGDASVKDSNTVIATSNINNPWDFFKSTVAARYYF